VLFFFFFDFKIGGWFISIDVRGRESKTLRPGEEILYETKEQLFLATDILVSRNDEERSEMRYVMRIAERIQ
jgi:hypothetical protein